MKNTVTGLALVILFSILYLYLELSGLTVTFFDTQGLQATINEAGYWGPILIIILIAGAVVMSPIPSAPIAIASGFAFGHSYGTLYVLIGAELGAIIAFGISRLLGYEAIQKRFGDKLKIKWLNSSQHLMAIVCISRLIPFISFDIVSYAAGLTKLSYLQFATATLIGIIPASFFLAHIGSEMATSDIKQMTYTIVLLGLITLISLVIPLIHRRSR